MSFSCAVAWLLLLGILCLRRRGDFRGLGLFRCLRLPCGVHRLVVPLPAHGPHVVRLLQLRWLCFLSVDNAFLLYVSKVSIPSGLITFYFFLFVFEQALPLLVHLRAFSDRWPAVSRAWTQTVLSVRALQKRCASVSSTCIQLYCVNIEWSFHLYVWVHTQLCHTRAGRRLAVRAPFRSLRSVPLRCAACFVSAMRQNMGSAFYLGASAPVCASAVRPGQR